MTCFPNTTLYCNYNFIFSLILYFSGILDNSVICYTSWIIVFRSFFWRINGRRNVCLYSLVCSWNCWWSVGFFPKVFESNTSMKFYIFSIRGILGSFLMIFTCFGVMISYIAGAYLTYSTAPFVIMIFPIAFMVSFLVLPESPQDLMGQKRYVVSLFIMIMNKILKCFNLSGCRKVVAILQELYARHQRGKWKI